MKSLGIYIHIPFCKKKCGYCDFYSVPGCDERLMDSYLSALVRQMDDYFGNGARPAVDTVYIGGGTPSLFGGKRIAKLLGELKKRVTLLGGAEVTVEVNPESVDKDLLKRLKEAGVNRASMGVQSTDNAELVALGRLHTWEEAQSAFALIKQYLTDNISIDLMYGLSGQTQQGWFKTLTEAAALGARHISCYCLKLEEGTPMFLQAPTLPDDDTSADMYLCACEKLEKWGYRQYEISNFAIKGYQARHNSKYWDLSEYLGLGCSAHSLYGGQRFSFISDVETFISNVAAAKPIAEEMDDMSVAGRMGEYVMLKLRTVEGIDPDYFFSRFGVLFDPYAQTLDKYISTGHVKKEYGRYRLTQEGFLISNVIISDVISGVCGGTI